MTKVTQGEGLVNISGERKVCSQMEEPGLKPRWLEAVDTPKDRQRLGGDFPTTTFAPLKFT